MHNNISTSRKHKAEDKKDDGIAYNLEEDPSDGLWYIGYDQYEYTYDEATRAAYFDGKFYTFSEDGSSCTTTRESESDEGGSVVYTAKTEIPCVLNFPLCGVEYTWVPGYVYVFYEDGTYTLNGEPDSSFPTYGKDEGGVYFGDRIYGFIFSIDGKSISRWTDSG